MDARHEKGLILSRDKRIKQVVGPTWAAPSQTDDDRAYLVNVSAATCSCPDFELRKGKCKHQWAVEIIRTVQTTPDGSTVVTESVKVTRKTYVQDWPRYSAAQCAEKETVQTLLRSLCDAISTPAHFGARPQAGAVLRCDLRHGDEGLHGHVGAARLD